MPALISHRGAIDALETYCLSVPFTVGPALQAARALSSAYAQGGAQVHRSDTKKLMRLFDPWLTCQVCVTKYT